jgi:hypothetical protein
MIQIVADNIEALWKGVALTPIHNVQHLKRIYHTTWHQYETQ